MKVRRLVTAAVACAFAFSAAFTYAVDLNKNAQGISAAYDNAELAGYADRIAELVNSERAAYGLNPVKVSPKLSEAANTRARELKQSFSHTRPNGTSCFTAISELGITYRAAAENIAYGQKSPESVMKAWMNSSGHRANILNASMEYIGVGAVYNNGVYYWSQFFAVSSDLSAGAYLPGGNYETPAEPEVTTVPEKEPEPEVTTTTEAKPEPEVTTAPETKPEPEVTTAPETKPEPEVTTSPEAKPEPEVTTAPEAKPEPEVTTSAEAKPEPEVTTSPEVKPEPEVTTVPPVQTQPQKPETTTAAPCVTDCDTSENCSGTECDQPTDCTPDSPCVTDCPPSGNCPDTGSQDSSDCYPSGSCPSTGNQSSADCNTSNSCPDTGNRNDSGCQTNIQDMISSITGGSSGGCNNNSGNSFGDFFSFITGSCNSGNSSGSCGNNNSSSGSCNNSSPFTFGTQSSSGCPLTDIFSSMFR